MPAGEPLDFADIPDPMGSQAASDAGVPGIAGITGTPRGRQAVLASAPMEAPAERSPTRAESTRNRRIVILAGAAWTIAVALGLGLRPDLLTAPVMLQLAVWTIALPLGLVLALRARPSGWPWGAPAVRAGLVVLVAAFVGLALLPVEGQEAPLTFRTVSGCLSYAVLIALPSLAGAAFVLKSAFLNRPALRGAMVGAVCGLAGTAGIHAHCPVVTVSHVLLAHGLPIAIFAALGALIGARRGRV